MKSVIKWPSDGKSYARQFNCVKYYFVWLLERQSTRTWSKHTFLYVNGTFESEQSTKCVQFSGKFYYIIKMKHSIFSKSRRTLIPSLDSAQKLHMRVLSDARIFFLPMSDMLCELLFYRYSKGFDDFWHLEQNYDNNLWLLSKQSIKKMSKYLEGKKIKVRKLLKSLSER